MGLKDVHKILGIRLIFADLIDHGYLLQAVQELHIYDIKEDQDYVQEKSYVSEQAVGAA